MVLIDDDPIYYITRQEEIEEKKITAMKNDFELLLIDLQSGTIPQDEFASAVQSCNQIDEDMYLFNRRIVYDSIYDDNPKTRAEYIKKKYNINTHYHENPDYPDPSEFKNIEYHNISQTFRLPGYSDVLRDNLIKAYEVGYNKMYETLKKKK